MAIITIARQIGSGGGWIAKEVARKLGYRYVDHQLIALIAHEAEVSIEEVEQYDEKAEGWIAKFLKPLLVPGGLSCHPGVFLPATEWDYNYMASRGLHESAPLDRSTYQLLITTLIQDTAAAGNAVIVGRAAQVILTDRPDSFHVKIAAPFEYRCFQIMEKEGVDFKKARELVERHDAWRRRYLQHHYKADWDDPFLYHLTINTDRMDREEAVALVVQSVRNADDPLSRVRREVLLHA